jgi:AcrR family transcriptional regulator
VASRDVLDPRVERSRDQVLAATLAVLREVGYGALTIEAVAARSGVAKSTIYRHWAGKAQLVIDTFERAAGHEAPVVPPPGPVRERVEALLRAAVGDLTSSADRLACLMPALIDAAERSDEIAVVVADIAECKAAALREVLDAGVAAGELPHHTDTAVLADALLGPILLARLFHRPGPGPADVPRLVDQVLPVVGPLPARTPA